MRRQTAVDIVPQRRVSFHVLIACMLVISVLVGSHPTHAAAGAAATTDRPVFISAARIAAIRSAVAHQRSPNYRAYHDDLLNECRSALNAGQHAPRTIYVPGFYVDRAGHSRAKDAIKTDANNVYALGLCYRITDEERYAEVAARIVGAWATTVQEISTADDTTLVLSYHFPAMIFGADLIRTSRAYQAIDTQFTAFLRQKLARASTIDRISRAGCGYAPDGIPSNNWSDWGTVLTSSIGAFTNDAALFDQAIQKWKANIVYQVDDHGNLPMEETRNNCSGNAGMNYSNFAMQALTLTAEIAAVSGIDLFHFTSGNSMPYERAWQRIAQLNRYPNLFSFSTYDRSDYTDFRYDIAWFEIANNYFPNDDARWVLSAFRPVVSREVFRYGTLTHGDLPLDLPTSKPDYPTGTWTIQSVSASSDDGNTPGNVLDGSDATRWSAQTDGEWIAFDAGQERYVDTCQVAFFVGDIRKADFTIELSDDGTNWKQVYSGTSSGRTTALQSFSFTPQVARYLRVRGYGNTRNDWNSLTEVRVSAH